MFQHHDYAPLVLGAGSGAASGDFGVSEASGAFEPAGASLGDCDFGADSGAAFSFAVSVDFSAGGSYLRAKMACILSTARWHASCFEIDSVFDLYP